jgi:hypothetical protein
MRGMAFLLSPRSPVARRLPSAKSPGRRRLFGLATNSLAASNSSRPPERLARRSRMSAMILRGIRRGRDGHYCPLPHRTVRAAFPHTAPAPDNGEAAVADCRMRPNPCSTLARPCVRSVRCWPAFPGASALRSTASSIGKPASFGGFVATMAGSDFSRPCITGFGSSPSQCGPPSLPNGGQTGDLLLMLPSTTATVSASATRRHRRARATLASRLDSHFPRCRSRSLVPGGE